MNPRKGQSAHSSFQATAKPKKRRRIRPPAGHPTDLELIAMWKGEVTKCPDGRAMGSIKSSDFGLAV